MLQVGLGTGPGHPPQAVTFAQHGWRQGCDWAAVEHHGAAPVAYVAHGSHATYPRPGTHDRPWPDPNDEAPGDGARVRPPVRAISDDSPAWVASRMHWGASRAAWWNPAEQTSPLGPRYQPDARWSAPAAFHAGARPCASEPPGTPWWVYAGLGVAAALALAARLRRRAARAC
jgi:MYXO-CTERM domain-containing protein